MSQKKKTVCADDRSPPGGRDGAPRSFHGKRKPAMGKQEEEERSRGCFGSAQKISHDLHCRPGKKENNHQRRLSSLGERGETTSPPIDWRGHIIDKVS